ncbi:prepilin peptidase [Candidatus Woesearchaeota archaeon]|nr:prepilin peptidase [Candidatus Woesearchaeota archaeon]
MTTNWLQPILVPSAITYIISFAALFVGSITDLKTREVPDWINYGLVASGLGLNLLFSAVYSNSDFIINSIAGLAIFYGVAYIMFYTGQWGGGDSKMLMGLGAVIGLDVSFKSQQFLAAFLINALLAGAAYGMLWSLFLGLKNRKNFLKEFGKALKQKNMMLSKKILLVLAAIVIIASFFIEDYSIRAALMLIALASALSFYLWISIRAIEKSSMFKLVEPSKLTEGDWIVNDIYVGKEYICGPKDLGIQKSQIRKLLHYYKRGKVRKILIKEGIPFVPSFFIAFIATWIFGSALIWLI